MINIYDDSKTLIYKLDDSKEINRGGEGRIIDVDNSYVVKLYLPNVNPIKKDKFDELSKLDSKFFVKPEKLIYDKNGYVIGFLMKKITSDYFPLLSIFNKAFCQRELISIAIKNKIIQNIISGVKSAHNSKVVIGDLNPFNILVNNSGNVYFIDVDSYQTTNNKHSGILLEDIRDFLYGGDVCFDSDYFALSTIIFNALTYVHPFKGISKVTTKLCDRMIKKESVLNCSHVIIPKCYEKITDSFLLKQFEKVFVNGERFLVDINPNIVTLSEKKQTTQIHSSSDLLVYHVFTSNNCDIINTAASKDVLLVFLSNGTVKHYNTSLKGSVIENSDKQYNLESKYFAYNNDIYEVCKNGDILDFNKGNKILSLNISENFICDIVGGYIVIVTIGKMIKVNIGERHGDLLGYDVVEVFGGAYSNIGGLMQRFGDKSILFYDKNGFNQTIAPQKISSLYQVGDCGICRIVSNESIAYKYYTIDNLKVNFFDCDLNSEVKFDCLNDSLIVVPKDDKLCFVRKIDMQTVASYDCIDISESDTTIHCTKAGIVCVDGNNILLMNKK